MIENLLLGVNMVFRPYLLFLIASGVIGGIIIGAIPGLTSVMAIALLVPITFSMEMIPAVVLLIGVYVGAISGGFISAILLNIPGTPSSVATTFDGYPMVMRGEHDKALGLALFSSFLGGIVSGLVLTMVAPILAKFAMKFGPFEYFALIIFAFSCVSSLSGHSFVKGLLASVIGLFLSTVGTGTILTTDRFTFGIWQLGGGFTVLPLLIGMFAIPQVLQDIKIMGYKIEQAKIKRVSVTGLFKALILFKNSLVNFTRSVLIGILIGVLPGVGAGLSNIISYSQAKAASKEPEKFGTGVPDGIIASESANNASMGGALIPLLALGIPGDTSTLMMLGAFMLHGLQPGPLFIQTNGDIVNSIFIAFFVAHIFMLLFQLFFMNYFIKVISIPKQYLSPIIIVLCIVGSFTLNNRLFDVWCFFGFGILGYILTKLEFPILPVVLGLILGGIAEYQLQIALSISQGSLIPLFTRPIAGFFVIAGIFFMFLPIIKDLIERKKGQIANN